ncbi:hypothetical protein Tco_0103222 [Tanacetum coccineum]
MLYTGWQDIAMARLRDKRPHTPAIAKTLQCSFVSLTSNLLAYHQGTVSLQKCFSEYQGIRHDQRLKMLLVKAQNPCIPDPHV